MATSAHPGPHGPSDSHSGNTDWSAPTDSHPTVKQAPSGWNPPQSPATLAPGASPNSPPPQWTQNGAPRPQPQTAPSAGRPFVSQETLSLPVQGPVQRTPSGGSTFRTDIQGLRAVAVGLVVLGHAGIAGFDGGYVGVDVFFVLSGFLITGLMAKEYSKTGTIHLGTFFARRARRILPMASIVAVATVVAAWAWFPVTRLESVLQDAFTTIVYVVNFRFASESVDYQNQEALASPFQQYWSLAVEEQFYLIWPLLLILAAGIAKKVGFRAKHIMLVAATLVLVISLLASIVMTESNPLPAYFVTQTRVWELAAGAVLALSLSERPRLHPVLAEVLTAVGLAMIFTAAFTFDAATQFPGYHAILPVLGTVLAILGGTGRHRTLAGTVLSSHPFQHLGKISYSLYLWHWPLLIIVPFGIGADPGLLLNIILIFGAVALSQLSYRYIENPTRKAPFLAKNSFMGISTGLISMAASLTAVMITFSLIPSSDSKGSVREIASVGELEQNLMDALETESVPSDLNPALAGVNTRSNPVYSDTCLANFAVTEPGGGCVYGATDSNERVMVIGDSHAAQWVPALIKIAESRGWRLEAEIKSSCPIAMVTIKHPKEDRAYSECSAYTDNLIAQIANDPPQRLIMTSSVAYDIYEVESSREPAAWLNGWDATVKKLQSHVPDIVILEDTPRSPRNVPDCLAENPNSASTCTFSLEAGMYAPGFRMAMDAVAQSNNAGYVPTADWFCVETGCPVIVEKILVYVDSNHISEPYIESLAPLLDRELAGR